MKLTHLLIILIILPSAMAAFRTDRINATSNISTPMLCLGGICQTAWNTDINNYTNSSVFTQQQFYVNLTLGRYGMNNLKAGWDTRLMYLDASLLWQGEVSTARLPSSLTYDTELQNSTVIRAWNNTWAWNIINNGTFQYNVTESCAAGNSIRQIYQNGSVICEADDTGGEGTGYNNCSVEGSCGLVTYDAELDNSTIMRNDNLTWKNSTGLYSYQYNFLNSSGENTNATITYYPVAGYLGTVINYIKISDNIRTGTVYATTALSTEGYVAAAGNIYSNSNIYTSGIKDKGDLWLGSSSQPNANFRAYADGTLFFTKLINGSIGWGNLTGIPSGIDVNNCSVEGSCSLISYDTELDNKTLIRTWNETWVQSVQAKNCSVEGSCPTILYTGQADKNCSTTGSCSTIAYETGASFTGPVNSSSYWNFTTNGAVMYYNANNCKTISNASGIYDICP